MKNKNAKALTPNQSEWLSMEISRLRCHLHNDVARYYEVQRRQSAIFYLLKEDEIAGIAIPMPPTITLVEMIDLTQAILNSGVQYVLDEEDAG